ncbi:MAG TPA: barnase inhibitor [Ruminococcus sp.]|nr:barnase inhibitor [Ruminococcus sp.]
MRTLHVTIDCSEITTHEEFHEAFASKLRLPGWYGENLDALYDCLTSLPQPTEIDLLHIQCLLDNLHSYGRAALSAILRAEREDPDRLKINAM